MGQDRYQRAYPSRNTLWPQTMNPEYSDHRYPGPQESREPPWTIDKALREKCHLSGEGYFVAFLEPGSGDVRVFTSTEPKFPQSAIDKVFDREAYKRLVQSLRSGNSDLAAASLHEDPDVGFESEHTQYSSGVGRRWSKEPRYASTLYEDDGNQKTRKRLRASGLRRETDYMDDDLIPTPTASSKRAIMVGNEKELWDFYEQRLKNCQQTACKLMAKAWIKAVEPKKQSTHPYTGKDEKAPDWWPQKWGESKEEKVRHKEPDHLYKRERVYLLGHILRMIMEPPERQHRDIQKLNLNITKLEEITNEALSSFFADKDTPSNAKKRPYLKEIFKVALQEERFRAGLIDPTTKVFVMSDDRIPDGYASDNEDMSPFNKNDDEQDHTPISASVSPPKGSAPHALMPQIHSDHGPSPHLPARPFESSLPVRETQYTQPVLPSGLPESSHYLEGSNLSSQSLMHGGPGSMPLHHDVSSYHPDSSRRSSMFGPSEYGSPTTPIYGSGGGWQAGTTAPSNSSMYSFTQQQQPATHTQFVGPHGVPMAQNQQFMTSGFDELSRSHDPTHDNMFQAGNVAQGPSSHPPGYPGYLQPDPRSLPSGGGIKMEQHQSLSRNIN